MKQYLYMVFFLPLLSCNSPVSKITEVDLENLNGEEITLSEIADDITYVPLDNDYPMSIYFQRIEILEDTIYLTEKDIGMFALDMSGKMVKRYGSKGRGPGEYMYGNKFTIDRKGQILYLLDMKSILKYSLDGTYLGKISLDKYPGNFKELRFKDSQLILFEYIALGEAVYDWIVMMTAPVTLSVKN
ncbi:MAG: 6-bladed beta-propeller [Bacteroidales bacterium]|nr:6-bladed beta-propeller [Bacteroidales bacterium]